jgi:hypothetical protein
VTRLIVRAVMTAVFALGAGIVVAIAVAIADLYVTGHGGRSINAPIFGEQSMGAGDVVFLLAILISAAATWWVSGRLWQPTAPPADGTAATSGRADGR